MRATKKKIELTCSSCDGWPVTEFTLVNFQLPWFSELLAIFLFINLIWGKLAFSGSFYGASTTTRPSHLAGIRSGWRDHVEVLVVLQTTLFYHLHFQQKSIYLPQSCFIFKHLVSKDESNHIVVILFVLDKEDSSEPDTAKWNFWSTSLSTSLSTPLINPSYQPPYQPLYQPPINPSYKPPINPPLSTLPSRSNYAKTNTCVMTFKIIQSQPT